MRNVVWIVLLFALVAAPLVVVAQDAEPAAPAAPEKPARKVDPAAMKLVEAAMAKMYSAKEEGLTSMTCVIALGLPQMPGMELKFDAKFVADGESTVKMRVPPEMASFAGQLEGQFGGLAKVFVDSCKGSFSDLEDRHVEMKPGTEDTVVLTAFRGEDVGSRSEVKFGANGLPERMGNAGGPQGEMTLNPRFEEKDGKFLMSGGTMLMMGQTIDLGMTYEKVGKFWVAKSLMFANLTLTASEIKVAPAGETTPSEDEGE
jgi:hypothetical protein